MNWTEAHMMGDLEAMEEKQMSDSVVKPFLNANDVPDEDVIVALEDALELARSGRMRSVAITATLTGNATFTTYSTRDLNEAIGLVGYLHHVLCARRRNAPTD